MLGKLSKRAQTTAEYAVLIALIVGAVIAMQIYVRRGLQGRIRDAVDHVGAGGDIGGGSLVFSSEQYEPYYLVSNATTNQTTNETENLETEGSVDRTSNVDIIVNREQTIGWFGREEEEE